MNQTELFTWLELAPRGVWAFAFFVLFLSIFSLTVFIYKQVRRILDSSEQISKAISNSNQQLNSRLEALEADLRANLGMHDQQIASLNKETAELRCEIAELRGSMLTWDILKRIELFLESINARGGNAATSILDAIKFETASRKDQDENRIERRRTNQ